MNSAKPTKTNKLPIKPFTSGQLPALGDVLNSYLIIHASSLKYLNKDSDWLTVQATIIDALKKAGFGPHYPSSDYLEKVNVQNVQICDVIQVPNAGSGPEAYRFYLVTGKTLNTIRTFPDRIPEDEQSIDPTFLPPYDILRPNFDSIADNADYEAFVSSVLTETGAANYANIDSSSFQGADLTLDSTHLQIGDLVFGVDPIQISFTTQNGFQIFPTIRTDGNPKMSTGQQIKSMSISLIFPNQDAINYQLIPLYAMFRRTPFVNIKNRDITKFFADLIPRTSSGYIPVALESINIQSIDGFPNSLQADITVLPFESRSLGNPNLRALLSMNDVIEQQEKLSNSPVQDQIKRIQEYKLQIQTKMSDRTAKDMIDIGIQSSDDFRRSFPFRAFYQSVIEDRDNVLDEHGQPAALISPNGASTYEAGQLRQFRPVRTVSKEDLELVNALRSYEASNNNTGIQFYYKYIPMDYLELATQLSSTRKQIIADKINQVSNYMNTVMDPKDLVQVLMPIFHTTDDLIRNYSYGISEVDNAVNRALQYYGWDVTIGPKGGQPARGIGHAFSVIFKTAIHMTSLGTFSSTYAQTMAALKDKKGPAATSSIVDVIYTGLTTTKANTSSNSGFGSMTIEEAFKEIWDYCANDKIRKEQLLNIIKSTAEKLTNIMTPHKDDALITDAMGGYGDEGGVDVERLPITGKVVNIDNIYDVVTNWTVSFANKFVPFYLRLDKYPFYQHLGFDDASLSLRVVSVPRPGKTGENGYDLKSRLSEMSDRVAENVKIITYSAPELLTWLDPRIEIVSAPNSIFHALGLNHVVLNASNTTNRQGQPDSWNTVINMTQAKYTVDQYHTIEFRANLSVIDTALLGLILRLKISDVDGQLIVKRYWSDVKHGATATNAENPEMRTLLHMSFVDSMAGFQLEQYLKALKDLPPLDTNEYYNKLSNQYFGYDLKTNVTNADLLSNYQFKSALDAFYPMWDREDTTATTKLREALNGNEQLTEIIKTVVRSYGNILTDQGQLYAQLITPKVNVFQSISSQLTSAMASMTKNLSYVGGAIASLNWFNQLKTGVGAIGICALLLTEAAYPIVAPVFIGSATVGGVGAIANAVKDQTFQTAKESVSNLLVKMADVVQRQVSLELSHALSKDPVVSDKLLSPEILYGGRPGHEQMAAQLNSYKDAQKNFKNFDCYSDFDMPPIVSTQDNSKAYVAPDFYLAINNIDDNIISTYIDDQVKTIGNTNRMAMQLCMISDVFIKQRFDNLLPYLYKDKGISPDILSKLQDNFKYVTDLNTSLKQSVKDYVSLSLFGAVPETDGAAPATDGSFQRFTDAQQKQLKSDLKETLNKDKTLTQGEIEELMAELDGFMLGTISTLKDTDAMKFNFIIAQRNIVLMELMEMFYSIGTYFAQNTQLLAGENPNRQKTPFDKILQGMGSEKDGPLTLNGQVKNALNDLKDSISIVMKKSDAITTSSLTGGTDKTTKTGPQGTTLSKDDRTRLLSRFKDNDGMAAAPGDSKGGAVDLAIPQVRILQNLVYNKIGYYIRLNSAIQDANALASPTSVGRINIDALPELKFLDYFNKRLIESSFREMKIDTDFRDSMNRQRNLNSRIFPTFKILFIEENGQTSYLDEYYAYNAIQSIEIVKNKNMASSTAVIRLSNVTGSLTDRLAFNREYRNIWSVDQPLGANQPFFGTLNVKPGCKILIKLGYGSTDDQLITVFSGRILEMNSGPEMELICQSFGAQLKSILVSENFSILTGIKEHGDIATAILDKIPGLEGFGSKELFKASILSSVSGKNFKNIKRQIFDRFMLTNMLGQVDPNLLGNDNPRDENIYLSYDLSPIVAWDPKFNWKVYNQTIWDALQELCLYHSNVNMIIRPYNNDGLSSRNEQRETIVIGQKSGYYKYTDAYALSSLDYAAIQKRISMFNDLKAALKQHTPEITIETHKKLTKREGLVIFPDAYSPVSSALVNSSTDINDISSQLSLKDYWVPIWNFFNDKTNFVIISQYILTKSNMNIDNVTGMVNNLVGLASQQILGQEDASATIDPSPEQLKQLLISRALTFLKAGFRGDITNTNLMDYLDKLSAFENLMNAIVVLQMKDPTFWDKISADQFYNVRALSDNDDVQLISDPRYTRIQKHHLVSDAYNLLNNNIILNDGFANMVNLYYPPHPIGADDSSGLTPNVLKKIDIWTTKSFRDISDEFLRPLNSFQKNINPKWMDVAHTEAFFKGYGRVNTAAKRTTDLPESVKAAAQKTKITAALVKTFESVDDVKKNLETALNGKYPGSGPFSFGVPDWRAFPSYMLVGVNLLKREVEQMYRGTLRLIGDPTIEPMDIVHLDDLLSDMQGCVEVEEVIHTFTPDQGFTTTITPCLITYDRDPQTIEDQAITNRIYKSVTLNRAINTTKAIGGAATAGVGIASAFFGNAVGGAAMGVAGAGVAWNGLMGMGVHYHRFLYDAMMEIMGGDVINFTALTYKGLPHMCGFDGVDYANLTTVINHKVDRIKNPITRMSAFSDPYAAWLFNGFDVNKANLTNFIDQNIRQIKTLKTRGDGTNHIGFFSAALGAITGGGPLDIADWSW